MSILSELTPKLALWAPIYAPEGPASLSRGWSPCLILCYFGRRLSKPFSSPCSADFLFIDFKITTQITKEMFGKLEQQRFDLEC